MKRKITPRRFLHFVALGAFGTIASPAIAQNIFFNNGALVYTAPSSIVQVNGGFENSGATAVFDNNGTMTVANSGTPGTVRLSSGSVMQGNGTYFVEQDWINDASFSAGNSTVILNGDLQQFITSNTGVSTTFNNLTLTGTGIAANRKKTLQLVNAS